MTDADFGGKVVTVFLSNPSVCPANNIYIFIWAEENNDTQVCNGIDNIDSRLLEQVSVRVGDGKK